MKQAGRKSKPRATTPPKVSAGEPRPSEAKAIGSAFKLHRWQSEPSSLLTEVETLAQSLEKLAEFGGMPATSLKAAAIMLRRLETIRIEVRERSQWLELALREAKLGTAMGLATAITGTTGTYFDKNSHGICITKDRKAQPRVEAFEFPAPN